MRARSSHTLFFSFLKILQYFVFAHTIDDASQFHITNMHQAVYGLSQTVTASAKITNSQFPFVTVPTFEMYGEHARQQSGIQAISYNPLISDSQKIAWNNYSVNHQDWIAESRQLYIQGLEAGTESGIGANESMASAASVARQYLNTTISPYIYNIDSQGNVYAATPPGPYLPFWQQSPPPLDPTFVNLNLMQEPYIQALMPPISLTRGTCIGICLSDFEWVIWWNNSNSFSFLLPVYLLRGTLFICL